MLTYSQAHTEWRGTFCAQWYVCVSTPEGIAGVQFFVTFVDAQSDPRYQFVTAPASDSTVLTVAPTVVQFGYNDSAARALAMLDGRVPLGSQLVMPPFQCQGAWLTLPCAPFPTSTSWHRVARRGILAWRLSVFFC